MHKTQQSPVQSQQPPIQLPPKPEQAALPPIRVDVQSQGFEIRVKAARPQFGKYLRMLRNPRSFQEAAAWLHGMRMGEPEVFNAVWYETVHRQGKVAQATLPVFGLSDSAAVAQKRHEASIAAKAAPAGSGERMSPMEEKLSLTERAPEWEIQANALKKAIDSAAPGSSIADLIGFLTVIAAQENPVGASARGVLQDFTAAEAERPSTVSEAIIRSMRSGRESKKETLNEPELRSRIAEIVRNGHWMNLFVIWGGFKEGGEGVVTGADKQAFETLDKFRKKIRELYSHITFTIIFCDVHAIDFAGTLLERIHQYLGKSAENKEGESLLSLADGHGMRVVKLSDIYQKSVDKLQPFGEEDYAEAKKLLELYPDYKAILEDAAGKHSALLKSGKKKAYESALKYLARRRFEARLFKAMDPRAIFLSFGDPEREQHLSDIPTFFIYPYGKKSDLPWFTIIYD